MSLIQKLKHRSKRKKRKRGAIPRLILYFCFGLLLGFLFYQFILRDLDFNEDLGIILGIVVALSLAIGSVCSVQIRCIEILTIPSFCGSTGRNILKALIVAFIIAGPLKNLSLNGREVIRVFACSTSLTYNLTKTRFVLMLEPFKNALFGMKANIEEVKDTMRSIRDVSGPIVKEIESENEMRKMQENNDYIDAKYQDTLRSKILSRKYEINATDGDGKKYEKKYLQKLETRCEDQLSRGAGKCRQAFAKAYDKCYDTVSWMAAWLLCWPMKLTFVCNIAEAMGGSKVCDPRNEMGLGIGDGYAYLKNAKNTFGQKFSKVKLQYEVLKVKPPLNIRQATDTAKAITHEFKENQILVHSILVLFKRCLAFLILGVIISAQKYHDNYLRHLKYDNIYITKYFRKIDARRHHQGKRTLLPLKKIEKKKLFSVWKILPQKSELRIIIKNFIQLFLEMISATVLILIDRLFFELLDLIHRHAFITYEQTGHHDLQIDVKGTGIIAGLLRSIVNGFNTKKRIKTVTTNEACLPRPHKLSSYYILKIYGSYSMIAKLIIFDAYSQRLRHVICGYLYPKREKQRTLFLYNETLKRRRGFAKHMRKKVVQRAQEQHLIEEYNFAIVLRIRYPKLFAWLRLFPCARRKCVICEDVEPLRKRRRKETFRRCGDPYCYVVYCMDCWRDIDGICLACTPGHQADSSGPDESDQSFG